MLNDGDTDGFQEHILQLQTAARQIEDEVENVNLGDSIAEIEQIGTQLKDAQEFLLKEIPRLKGDLDANVLKLDFATELRTIDQTTLQSFRAKFQELTQLLANIKKREVNAWHLVQILRVNTSRLWNIFQSATGVTIGQQLIHQDLQILVDQAQTTQTEQRTTLTLLEQQHAELLIKMKEIQLSLELVRTSILKETQATEEVKHQTANALQTNHRIQEESMKRINHLLFNVENVQVFLLDYKSLLYQVQDLSKVIAQTQAQLESHHQSIFVHQTKLDRYKQDLALALMQQTDSRDRLVQIQEKIREQTDSLQQLEIQQQQIREHRQEYRKQIAILEQERNEIFHQQYALLDTIKQAMNKKSLLDKEVLQSNREMKSLQHSYRQFTKDQQRLQERTHYLQRTVQTNEQHSQIVHLELYQRDQEVQEQNQRIHLKEVQIESLTKELHDLENCGLNAREELQQQRAQVGQSQAQLKLLTQKLHKLKMDEKPILNEIVHDEKQLGQVRINHLALQLHRKENLTRIQQYESNIAKLMVRVKQDDHRLAHESSALQECNDRIRQSKEKSHTLNHDLQSAELNQQYLKDIARRLEEETIELKQNHGDLTFLVRLIERRHEDQQRQLQVLYQKSNHQSKEHDQTVLQLEQANRDLQLLCKYEGHLRSRYEQLHSTLAHRSAKTSESLKAQSTAIQVRRCENQLQSEARRTTNHIHYWHALMISSPDQFNDIAKLFLIKKKLVQKCNELTSLKAIVKEKETLQRYLSQLERRHQQLIDRTRLPDCRINCDVSSVMKGDKKCMIFTEEQSSTAVDETIDHRTGTGVNGGNSNELNVFLHLARALNVTSAVRI